MVKDVFIRKIHEQNSLRLQQTPNCNCVTIPSVQKKRPSYSGERHMHILCKRQMLRAYNQNGVRKGKSWWWSPFSTPNNIFHRPPRLGSVLLRRTQLQFEAYSQWNKYGKSDDSANAVCLELRSVYRSTFGRAAESG